MFGDLILWIREKWKQFWCIHEYQQHDCGPTRLWYECKKCGKVKGPIFETENVLLVLLILSIIAFALLYYKLR